MTTKIGSAAVLTTVKAEAAACDTGCGLTPPSDLLQGDIPQDVVFKDVLRDFSLKKRPRNQGKRAERVRFFTLLFQAASL